MNSTIYYLYIQSHLLQAQTNLQQNQDQLAQSQKDLHQANNNSQQVGPSMLTPQLKVSHVSLELQSSI